MKKILAFLFVFCFIFADETLESDATFLSVFSQINEVNSQILVLKTKAKDSNQSSQNSILLDTILSKKHKLLEQVPNMIMKINVDEKEASKFKDKKVKLENIVAK